MFLSNHGEQHLISVWRLFSLGKLTNQFLGHAPPLQLWSGVKNFRKVFAGRGGQKFLFWWWWGGGVMLGESRNFEVKIKTA